MGIMVMSGHSACAMDVIASKPEIIPKVYPPGPIKMCVVVNTDLEMSVGKIGEQIGRAVSKLYTLTETKDATANEMMNSWRLEGEQIIILGATEKEIHTLPVPDISAIDPQTGLFTIVAWAPTRVPPRGYSKLKRL